MQHETDPTTGVTVVRESPAVWVAVWAGFPLVGGLLGWGLVAIAGWVTSLSWAPMQGPFELVQRYSGWQVTTGAIVLGAVAGLVLALIGASERLVVTLSRSEVRLRRDSTRTSYPAREVRAAFDDAKHLVLLDAAGAELAREKHDLPRDALAAAFTAQGYRWLDADPYARDYRPWVDDADGLPPGANAVLKARARALEQDEKEHVTDLRTELARLGVVVRDEKRHQFWRPVARG